MVPLSPFLDKSLSKERHGEEDARPHLTPTHSSVSDVKRPMDEEIVPFRLLDDKSLLKEKKNENSKKKKFQRSTNRRVTTAPTQVSADPVQFEEGEKRGQMVLLQPTNKKNKKKIEKLTRNEGVGKRTNRARQRRPSVRCVGLKPIVAHSTWRETQQCKRR
jgi:hypothetical protein